MPVIITTEDPPAGDSNDEAAAFAHGEAVGEFRSHMTECASKHSAHEMREAELEARLSAIESTAQAAQAAALVASVQASAAQETADDALETSEEEPSVQSDVVEMEMPDIPTEQSEEEKPKSGFHLW